MDCLFGLPLGCKEARTQLWRYLLAYFMYTVLQRLQSNRQHFIAFILHRLSKALFMDPTLDKSHLRITSFHPEASQDGRLGRAVMNIEEDEMRD